MHLLSTSGLHFGILCAYVLGSIVWACSHEQRACHATVALPLPLVLLARARWPPSTRRCRAAGSPTRASSAPTSSRPWLHENELLLFPKAGSSTAGTGTRRPVPLPAAVRGGAWAPGGVAGASCRLAMDHQCMPAASISWYMTEEEATRHMERLQAIHDNPRGAALPPMHPQVRRLRQTCPCLPSLLQPLARSPAALRGTQQQVRRPGREEARGVLERSVGRPGTLPGPAPTLLRLGRGRA